MVLIVDGSFVLHRAMHLPGANSVSGGVPVGAVESSLRTLTAVVRGLQPSRVFWVQDRGPHPERLALYPDYKRKTYKTHEEEIEAQQYRDSYHQQRDVLCHSLSAFGVHLIYGPYESDDTIWYLSSLLNGFGIASSIATEDRDFVQLMSPTVSIYRLGNNEDVPYDKWKEFSLWSPKEIVLAKAILGDSSDNIPSPCHGLGKVGLRKLFAAAAAPTLCGLQEVVEKNKMKAAKYQLLFDPEVAVLINRNIRLTMLGLVGFQDDGECGVVRRTLEECLAFSADQVMGFLVRTEMAKLIESFGYWSRAFEGLI